MKLSKFIAAPLSILIIFICTASCSKPHYTEYHLIVNIHEYEVKNSPDVFDEKPEVFFQVDTESEIDTSDVFNEYKVNFVEQGKTYNFSLKGKAHDDEVIFSVNMYDDDALEDVVDAIFGDGDDHSDFIEGTTVTVKIPDGDLSGTVTIDGEDGYLKFSYLIENLVEK